MNRPAERFEGFAEWCVGTSPLYARLAREVADDQDLIDLAAGGRGAGRHRPRSPRRPRPPRQARPPVVRWPEHADRHRLIEEAADVVSEHPPRLVEGDAAERLPAVLSDLDDPVAVVDTRTLYQMAGSTRERYRVAVAESAREREVHWLSGSGAVDDREHGIALRWGPTPGTGSRRSAVYEQHGRWIEWLGA